MVSSYTSLLGNQYKDQLGEEGNDYIKFAYEGAQRMSTLINDLLDYARIGKSQIKFEQSDCNDLLEDVVFNLSEITRESNAKITWGALPVLNCSQSYMRLMFQNLIANAIKFRGNV